MDHIHVQAAFKAATGSGLVLVKLGADDRCAPCRAVGYVLPRLALDLGIKMIALDVDEAGNKFIRDLEFHSIPHFLLYVDGKLVDQRSGFEDYPALRAWLKGAVSDARRAAGLPGPGQDTDDERLFAEAAARLWSTYQETVRPAWALVEPMYGPAIAKFKPTMSHTYEQFAAGEIDAVEREKRYQAARHERDLAIGPLISQFQEVDVPAYDAYVFGLKALCEGDSKGSDAGGGMLCTGGACSLKD